MFYTKELPVSRAPLQFPGVIPPFRFHFPDCITYCITCYHPVPRMYHAHASSSSRLYHLLPSSSQTVSRSPLQFPDCITITSSLPVPWLDHIRPSISLARSRVQASERVFKIAKRTVKNKYSLKSEKCRNVIKGILSLNSRY